MKKIVIIGAGGQCRAVLGILDSINLGIPYAIYDLAQPRKDEFVMGIPVVKIPSDIELTGSRHIFSFIIAIGDNKEREIIYNKLCELNCEILTIISSLAVISKSASLGNGVVVSPNVFVGPFAQVGDNTILNTGTILEHEAIIGKHSHLAPASIVCGRSKIGDLCFIGANSTIIEKISIASNTIIGAGSVVIKSIQTEGFTWVGGPAKKIEK